jgi:hypothetical protein
LQSKRGAKEDSKEKEKKVLTLLTAYLSFEEIPMDWWYTFDVGCRKYTWNFGREVT